MSDEGKTPLSSNVPKPPFFKIGLVDLLMTLNVLKL